MNEIIQNYSNSILNNAWLNFRNIFVMKSENVIVRPFTMLTAILLFINHENYNF